MITAAFELLGQGAAAVNRSGRAREGLARGPTDDWMWLAVGLAALIAVIWLVFRVIRARGTGRTRSNPRKLYRSLCQVHGLAWSDRRLLRKLARSCGLADPSRLFVDPLCFEQGSLHGALHAHAARISELRRRLFGA
jgi:hypothetical protein